MNSVFSRGQHWLSKPLEVLLGSADPIARLGLRTINKRFRLESAIAGGKSSKTYFGKDLEQGDLVVIKLLMFPRSDLERALFHNEIYTLQHFDDIQPRITPRIFVSGELYEGDIMYMVTEKVEGRTLERYLQDDLSFLNLNSKLELFHRVASCVASCLGPGWNHRDLHPGNVLLLEQTPIWLGPNLYSQPDPKTMLLDWGQSYCDLFAQFDDAPPFIETLHGCYFKSFTASLYSSPPEIFREPEYQHRTISLYDSWSLGLILHRILTGKNCFEFRSLGDYAQSLANKNIHTLIDSAASQILRQGNEHSFLLSQLFKRLACVDAAQRLHAGTAARVLWDLRIEGWRPASEAEAIMYIANPYSFVPEGGWKYSRLPEIDEG
ncbi:MAG: protein kinase [Cyanobacteria bacterium]|nr:protein kinase [Cyanobacteriota bacterium]